MILAERGDAGIYFFSRFAVELNEEEESVAPTDSRLRPDQRLMEIGNWEESNEEKVRLEGITIFFWGSGPEEWVRWDILSFRRLHNRIYILQDLQEIIPFWQRPHRAR